MERITATSKDFSLSCFRLFCLPACALRSVEGEEATGRGSRTKTLTWLVGVGLAVVEGVVGELEGQTQVHAEGPQGGGLVGGGAGDQGPRLPGGGEPAPRPLRPEDER